jgi:ribosomal-protein-alanine N-acetyltransferase
LCEIRRGGAGDLEAVAAIQAASPEASHWPPADYLDCEFRVAQSEGAVVAFLAGRSLGGEERELLNLAVQPEYRRKGIGRRLLEAWLGEQKGVVYLEVRESNWAARRLYQTLGCHEVNARPDYYESPPEAAIVLKFHSC